VSKTSNLLTRFMSMFRSAQPAGDMSNRDLERELLEELRPLEPTLDWIVAYLPAQNPNRVVYTIYVPGVAPDYLAGYAMFQRAFTLAENGEVTIDAARVEVEPVTYYEPVLMNEDEPELVDAAGKRNSAKDQKTIQDMHDHAVALGAYCAPTAAATKPDGASGASAVATTPETVNKENRRTWNSRTLWHSSRTRRTATRTRCARARCRGPEARPGGGTRRGGEGPTFAELLEAADPTVRAAISEGVRVAGERKTATIKALKDSGRCKFSDEQLGDGPGAARQPRGARAGRGPGRLQCAGAACGRRVAGRAGRAVARRMRSARLAAPSKTGVNRRFRGAV
jgi:hypothetical protein